MSRSLSFLISTFIFLSGPLYSQYDFDTNCQKAYQEILSFRFKDASFLLQQEKGQHPDNLIPVFLENYIDFFKLFTGEDKLMFETLKKNKSERLDILEKGDKESPFYTFCLAGVNLQWAFARLKFGEYTTAAFEIRRAYLLLKENEKRFPDFLPNQIGLGILHIIVGLVPEQYQWLVSLAGFEGTITEGMSELQSVLVYDGDSKMFALFKPEACFYMAFVDVNLLNNKKESLSLIHRFDVDPQLKAYSQSPLIVYAKCSIYLKNGKNDDVISLLENYHPAPGTYPFVFLYYLEGLARLNRLDPSSAALFDRFLKEFQGINYIKAGYQKLAWTYLIQGDTVMYKKVIMNAGTAGNTIVDEDKQARSEQNVEIIPALPLLKARLLYDGGYYQDALKVLLNTPLESYMRSKKDLAEYLYRLGRIYHAQGNMLKAIQYYTAAVENGRNLPHYFAASAALNLGWIYEEEGNFEGADTNFRLCASMRYDEYENSLRQKAKAGLSRLKNSQN
ncbi:MAG: tetratricopeptide repeat protein [Bacteroidales bacterium]|nr:tetratricopeptide repeat protein [Bacteroidales bacterium]